MEVSYMSKTIKRLLFLIFFMVFFTLQFNISQATTKDEIKAKMKKIDGQVTRIDREITANKNKLNLLDDQKKYFQSFVRNPKIYPIKYKGKSVLPLQKNKFMNWLLLKH